MRVLAIDPGTDKSAYIVWNSSIERVSQSGIVVNGSLSTQLRNAPEFCDFIACEMIASYGMAVGKETFETCLWIGRFQEAASAPFELVYRRDIKLHLCGTARAKDANIRQALIDKYGAPGTKKNPGPTHGITSHLWSALAVADYALSQQAK